MMEEQTTDFLIGIHDTLTYRKGTISLNFFVIDGLSLLCHHEVSL